MLVTQSVTHSVQRTPRPGGQCRRTSERFSAVSLPSLLYRWQNTENLWDPKHSQRIRKSKLLPRVVGEWPSSTNIQDSYLHLKKCYKETSIWRERLVVTSSVHTNTCKFTVVNIHLLHLNDIHLNSYSVPSWHSGNRTRASLEPPLETPFWFVAALVNKLVRLAFK